jgi:hypothetical protein
MWLPAAVAALFRFVTKSLPRLFLSVTLSLSLYLQPAACKLFTLLYRTGTRIADLSGITVLYHGDSHTLNYIRLPTLDQPTNFFIPKVLRTDLKASALHPLLLPTFPTYLTHLTYLLPPYSVCTSLKPELLTIRRGRSSFPLSAHSLVVSRQAS